MRRAFSLVELLVVIGIIAVLIAIILPTLSRAREASSRTVCLSNIRQLGVAMIMYADANKGRLPYPAVTAAGGDYPRDYDWIFWQRGRKLEDSAIAKYLGKFFAANVLLCPSDDLRVRKPLVASEGPYNFSYSLNELVVPYRVSNPPPPTHIARIRRASEIIMLVDENEQTVNDGMWFPFVGGNGSADLLAIRHDIHRPGKDVVNPLNNGGSWIPQKNRRGNVAFIDGHADYVTREIAHNSRYYDPRRP